MRGKLLGILAVVALSATITFAQWVGQGRQVEIRGNTINNLGQDVGSYAPTNSLQAYIEWIDDNWGDGVDTNASYYFVDGTTQNYWRVIIRDYLTVNGSATIATNLWVGDTVTASNDLVSVDDVIVGDDLIVNDDASIGGDLSVTGNLAVTGNTTIGGTLTYSGGSFLNTSNDLAVGYLGYPKLVLTTNMVTWFSDGGTLISNTFASCIDADITTCGTGTLAASKQHDYQLDLGQNYEGWMIVTHEITNNSATSMKTWNFASWVSEFDDQVYSHGNYSQFSSVTGTNKLTQTTPFAGRYVTFRATQGAAGGSQTYKLFDVSIYATTNGYRNMGGF